MATPRRHRAPPAGRSSGGSRRRPAGAVREPRPARAPARMADVDPKAAKRAERQVATLFGISAIGTLLTLVVYFTVKFDTPMSFMEHLSRLRISTTGIGVGLFLALFGIGVGRRPLGQDAHAGRGARRGPAPPARLGRRPRRRGDDPQGGRRGVRPRPPAADPQLASSVRWRSCRCRPSCCCGTPARCPATTSRTTFWKAGMRLLTDPQLQPDPAAGHADRLGRAHRARRA